MSAGASKSKTEQVRDFVIYILFIGLIALAFSVMSSAEPIEGVKVHDITALIPSSFVNVEGNVDFSSVLPGYPYSRQVNISLNLPQSALSGLRSSNVTVFVKLSTLKGENSAILFETDGMQSKFMRFSLVCVVRDSSCVEGSILNKVVKVNFAAPSSGYPYVDQVIINSSLELVPLNEVEEKAEGILAQAIIVQKKLEEVHTKLKVNANPSVVNDFLNPLNSSNVFSSNFSNELAAVNTSLQEAVRYASTLKVNDAENSLQNAQGRLNFLQNASSQLVAGSSSSAGHSGLLTGIIDADLSKLWEPIAISAIGIALLCVYIYRKEKNDKKKRVDVNRFMRDSYYK